MLWRFYFYLDDYTLLVMNKNISRFLQKKLLSMKQIFIFKTSHISLWWKIALFWVSICFISLFFPWVSSPGIIISSWETQIDSFIGFSKLLGRVWFFIFLALIIVLFSIFSIRQKEKFRYFSMVQISDHMCVLMSSIFIFLLSIQSFLLIWWLQIFASNISHGKWIILSITWAMIMFFSSFIIQQEYRKNIKWSYVSDAESKRITLINEEKKNNMKLPF